MDRQAKHPFHPGEMSLEEFPETLGMSQAEFAPQIAWTEARLNELIRGKRGVACRTTAWPDVGMQELADANPGRNVHLPAAGLDDVYMKTVGQQ